MAQGQDEEQVIAQQKAEDIISKDVPTRWTGYIWDTFDKSPAERKFLFKLDAALLILGSLGFFIKFLDQANVPQAFVSGMKEDLNLYGLQLNYLTSVWTAGYIVGQIPSNIALTRVRPSIWLPSIEVFWSVLTFACCQAKSVNTLYALRFFIGLAESAFYPGIIYILGSWYRKDELAKRACIFYASSAIGVMFSGYLMAAVYNLEGRGGFKGWQWLFIVDGIISLPIALSGYIFLPDLPQNTRAFYLTKEEIAYGKRRVEVEGRKGKTPYTKAKIFKILTSWRIWVLTVLYVLFNNAAPGSTPIFAQFLKASTNPQYAVWQINVYPTITYAVEVVAVLTYGWISDGYLKGRRWPPVVFGAIVSIICYVSLAVWDISLQWKWACFALFGAGIGSSGLLMAWASEICSDDNEERAIVVACMNEMAYVLSAWLPIFVWPQTEAPQYQRGYITISCLSFLLIVMTFVTRWLQKRDLKRKEESFKEENDSGIISELAIVEPKT